MKHTISFIGAGTMGSGMIKNLVARGFPVEFYNRTKKAIPGAKYVALDKLSGDIVFICLPNDAAIKEVFQQLNLKKGQILVDCSTTSLEMTTWVAKECKQKNVEFLDAPLTGSKIGAESGQLVIMVGGDKKAFDSLQDVFAAVSKKVVYCGGNGYGQRAKHALNLAQSNILTGYLEALMLGMKLGVKLDALLDVFENSAAQNGVGRFKLPYIRKRDFTPHFLLWLMHKDLKLAEEEMKLLSMQLPLSQKTIALFDEAMNAGLENEDFAAVVKVLEEKNKIAFT